MSRSVCRRVRHELVDRFRVGALVIDVGPQLDHLGGCAPCREAVAADRALVIQVRRALAERVGDATPPQHVWLGIVRDAQRVEPRPSLITAWWATLAGRLRMGTAIAATGLAVVLSVNPQPGTPDPSPPAMVTVPATAAPTPRGGAAPGSSSAELDTLERFTRVEPRGLATGAEGTVAVPAPAPEDGLPPGEHRPAGGESAVEHAIQQLGANEMEQVPVLQEPYRSPAPAPDGTEPEAPPEEAPVDNVDTVGDERVADRWSVRD